MIFVLYGKANCVLCSLPDNLKIIESFNIFGVSTESPKKKNICFSLWSEKCSSESQILFIISNLF